MRLDDISVALRPRHAWEAIDLGFAMVRRWWRALFIPWLTLLSLSLLLLAPLWWWQPPLALLVIWWVKPLYDRLLLFILSRALFGATPGLRQTLAALPAQLGPQALASLVWLRLDPRRSFHLPVIQLEGLRGKARRRRQRLLDAEQGGGGWLTVVCVHLDIVLQLSLYGLAGMLFPELTGGLWADPQGWLADGWGGQLLSLAVAVAALAVIEPFYVAGGFALYLNRRTWLEAWDIEIGFRRLAERLRHTAVTTLAVLTLGLTLLGVSPPAAAQTDISPECRRLQAEHERLRRADSEVKRVLAEVLQEEPFPRCERELVWRRTPREQPPDAATPPWVRQLAGLLRGLLWLLLGAAVLWLLYRALHHRPRLRRQTRPSRASPPPRVVRDTPVERFDDTTAALALALARDGRQREALSLLYRASLARLGELGVDLSGADTEGQCLSHSARQLGDRPALLDFFSRLTDCWQGLAYAHRSAEPQRLERLCQEWARHFAAGETGSGTDPSGTSSGRTDEA